ncbi:MAG: hypothetical protein ACI87E_004079 [Mariniblastus sp.]
MIHVLHVVDCNVTLPLEYPIDASTFRMDGLCWFGAC